MKLVAVNGRRYSSVVLDEAIIAAQATRRPISLLVEKGDYFSTLEVGYFDGPRFPHLVRIEGRVDNLAATLAPRTGG
jgi:hypothetical protein